MGRPPPACRSAGRPARHITRSSRRTVPYARLARLLLAGSVLTSATACGSDDPTAPAAVAGPSLQKGGGGGGGTPAPTAPAAAGVWTGILSYPNSTLQESWVLDLSQKGQTLDGTLKRAFVGRDESSTSKVSGTVSAAGAVVLSIQSTKTGVSTVSGTLGADGATLDGTFLSYGVNSTAIPLTLARWRDAPGPGSPAPASARRRRLPSAPSAMTLRPIRATFVAVASLSAAAACAPEAPVGVADAAPRLARGSSGGSTPIISVAGNWAGTYRSATDPSDTTQWSLNLRQNGDRLEGGLVRIYYVDGTSAVGVSAVKRGSVSGQNVSLEFDRGEGAEVGPTFSGTVSDDGRTMLGFHSRYPEPVTLTRR